MLAFAGQRKCGAFGTVVPSAVLCVVVVVNTIALSAYIFTWNSVCDVMTTAGKNSSWSIIIIVPKNMCS